MSKSFAAFMLLSLLGVAHADDKVIEKPLSARALEQFKQEDEAIRAAMQSGGRYEFLKNEDKGRVDAGLASIKALMERRAGKSELSERETVNLLNVEEEVNAILKHNDSNRLVCERSNQMGSHIPVTTCRTYGEIEQRRADSQKELKNLDTFNRTRKN